MSPADGLYTPQERAVLADVVTWSTMSARSGIPAGTLRQWYARPSKRIGQARYTMRDLAGSTEGTPLFLWRVVREPLMREKLINPGRWPDGTEF